MEHKRFIAWAYNRHCTAPHNADFEVCQDKACQRAVKYEQDDTPFTDPSAIEQEEPNDICYGCGRLNKLHCGCNEVVK